MSSLTHFPLEQGYEDYSFLDQAVADVEQGLDSILTDSIETPELDTSMDEPDAVISSVSSWFLHLVSTISDNNLNCSLLLEIGLIKCGARLGPSCTCASGYQDVSI